MYLGLLRQESVADIRHQLSASSDELDVAFRELADKSLVSETDEGFDLIPPHQAYRGITRAHVEQIEQIMNRLSSLRTVAPTLADEFLRARTRPGEVSSLLLDDDDTARERFSRFSRDSHRVVMSMVSDLPLARAAVEASEHSDIEALQRGLRLRMIVSEKSLSVGFWADYLKRMVDRGLELRVCPSPPTLMIISDEERMIIPVAGRQRDMRGLWWAARNWCDWASSCSKWCGLPEACRSTATPSWRSRMSGSNASFS